MQSPSTRDLLRGEHLAYLFGVTDTASLGSPRLIWEQLTMTVYLREITAANWKEAIRIDVAPEQKRFVASNIYSVAESKFDSSYVPLGIYNQAETMVGFVMYGLENGEHWILRLMVAHQYQGRGYGRAAMLKIIRRLRAKHQCQKILTSYKPDNHVAAKL